MKEYVAGWGVGGGGGGGIEGEVHERLLVEIINLFVDINFKVCPIQRHGTALMLIHSEPSTYLPTLNHCSFYSSAEKCAVCRKLKNKEKTTRRRNIQFSNFLS